tara:strand:+ start:74 stop:421 length:348 start_codon:yes stop_codon:yes gene_type:complete
MSKNMKITKQKLTQIIKEEISTVMEQKEAHIDGIVKKLVRLKQAVRDAEKGMENMEARAEVVGGELSSADLHDIMTHPAYGEKQIQVSNLNDKIELLVKQLKQLKQDEPGQLERT